MTPNKEDYLKCIYEIGSRHKKITNKEIAQLMQVSPPAVTEMMKKMLAEELLVKDKKAGYLLTDLGLRLVSDLDPTLAVLSDPASVTPLYGTRQDFLIPSACLNATVSGLVSRTVKLKEMSDDELHGAVYYAENEAYDHSLEFLDKVQSYFDQVQLDYFNPSQEELNEDFKGLDEVKKIAQSYNISDINKIKPGVGETTRVLLRRLPDRVLIREKANQKYLKHILQLCEEKQIPIEYVNLQKYNVCGIIKEVADL